MNPFLTIRRGQLIIRYSIFISLFFVPFLISGCASTDKTYGIQWTVQDVTRKYNGKIGNLLGDGQVTAINSQCRGFGRGPAAGGKYSVAFDLTPGGPTNPPMEFHLCFIFPVMPAGQILVTNTASRAVEVLFSRSDADHPGQHSGERMTGRVAIKWNSDSDFVIGADLTLPDDASTWVRGEFVGTTKTNINPILYDWPAVLLFHQSR